MAVPFNDLFAQYKSIKSEIDDAIDKIIRGSAFIRGESVELFEAEYAAAVDSDHCVSCANGTDALYIAMKSLGIKPGDEVIVPAHSWISTSETVTQAGGRVVFCDTSSETYTLDVSQLERKITNKTVGIIPVHLFGHPADMSAVCEIASRHGLWIIEDCAQAHLATFEGNKVGTFGDMATYSFYPGKNLGAMGDAGAIVTNDASLASYAAKFARHGGLQKGIHEIEGINSRLDGLQAAILRVKLPHLPLWTEQRRLIASRYNQAFRSIEAIGLTEIDERCDPVWHLYVIRSEEREKLQEYLRKKAIETVINYPTALPFLPAYRYLRSDASDFKNAKQHQDQILSLPIFPEMTDEMIDEVIDAVSSFFC